MKKIFFIAIIAFACTLPSCISKKGPDIGGLPNDTCKLNNNVALNKFLDEVHASLEAEIELEEEIKNVRPLTAKELELNERRQGKLEVLHQLDELRENN